MLARLELEPLEDRVVPAAFQTLPILPFSDLSVLDHVRAIASRGESLGREPNTILKIGDSNSAPFPNLPPGQYNPGLPYLTPLGSPTYNPVASGLATLHGDLLATWDTYRSGSNSFVSQWSTASPGWSTGSVLSTLSPQITSTNAGIAIVMIGTNDILHSTTTSDFTQNLTNIINPLLAAGVVPILSTIPDMSYYGDAYDPVVLAFNQVIAEAAERYELPLWNFWAALNQLPSQGLDALGVHLSTSPNGGGNFGPGDLMFGQNVRNLQTLQILNWFQNSVVHAPLQQIAPSPSWQSLEDIPAIYAVSREIGFSPTVGIRDGSGQIVNRFLAFSSTFSGGVRLALGDVNGDGVQDVACVTASGADVLRLFSGKDGTALFRANPFGTAYLGGLTVAVGDLDSDGTSEVVVGQGSGGSQVAVYRRTGGSFAMTTAFRAFPNLGTNGVSVAVANVRDAGPQIVVSAMSASATVRLFSGSGQFRSTLRPYSATATFGLTVVAVDLNGSGFDQLAVARVSGGGGVRVVDPVTGAVQAVLPANPSADTNWGLRLGRIRSAGSADTLLVGNGPGSRTSLLAFRGLGGVATQLPPAPIDRAFGIFVGG